MAQPLMTRQEYEQRKQRTAVASEDEMQRAYFAVCEAIAIDAVMGDGEWTRQFQERLRLGREYDANPIPVAN